MGPDPSWLTGASLAVDYFNIKIEDSIANSSPQEIVQQCFAGNTEFCSAITRNQAGLITQVDVIPFNAASETAAGIDVEFGYSTDLGNGRLQFRGLVNYIDKLEIVSPNGFVTTRAGELGTNRGTAQGVPHLRGLATLGYQIGAYDFQLKGRYIGEGKMEVDWGPKDINFNDVPAIFYLDAFAGAEIEAAGLERVQVFLAIQNLLNTSPPVVLSDEATRPLSTGTNIGVYDTIGRAFRVGVRFEI